MNLPSEIYFPVRQLTKLLRSLGQKETTLPLKKNQAAAFNKCTFLGIVGFFHGLNGCFTCETLKGNVETDFHDLYQTRLGSHHPANITQEHQFFYGDCVYMGIRGTPKWMVYNGKPY